MSRAGVPLQQFAYMQFMWQPLSAVHAGVDALPCWVVSRHTSCRRTRMRRCSSHMQSRRPAMRSASRALAQRWMKSSAARLHM